MWGVWIARSESSSLPLFHPRVLTWTALLLVCLIFFIAIAIICSKNEKWQRMLAMQKARKIMPYVLFYGKKEYERARSMI